MNEPINKNNRCRKIAEAVLNTTNSIEHVANQFGCSKSTVRRCLDKYELELLRIEDDLLDANDVEFDTGDE